MEDWSGFAFTTRFITAFLPMQSKDYRLLTLLHILHTYHQTCIWPVFTNQLCIRSICVYLYLWPICISQLCIRVSLCLYICFWPVYTNQLSIKPICVYICLPPVCISQLCIKVSMCLFLTLTYMYQPTVYKVNMCLYLHLTCIYKPTVYKGQYVSISVYDIYVYISLLSNTL